MPRPQYQHFLVDKMIKRIIREEVTAQGHDLSGLMGSSVQSKTSVSNGVHTFSVFMIYYAQYVDEGVPAAKVSMKMFPFVYAYFVKRGFEQHSAKKAAAATIMTWMRTGIPSSNALFRSKTGSRTRFVEDAFKRWESGMDAEMEKGINFDVETYFLKIEKI